MKLWLAILAGVNVAFGLIAVISAALPTHGTADSILAATALAVAAGCWHMSQKP
jgi:hypothetical protein